MTRLMSFASLIGIFIAATVAAQQPAPQYPMMEAIAQKVIQKYQTATCEQLWAEKTKPPNPQQAQTQDKAVQLLRQDPAMRKAFVDKVAPSIVNKMFECGMVP